MPREYLLFADVEPEGSMRPVVALIDLSVERANRLLDLRVPFEQQEETHPIARPHAFSYHWYDFVMVERGDFLQAEGFVDYDVVDSQMIYIRGHNHPTYELEIPRVLVRENGVHFRAYVRRNGECVSNPIPWPIIEKLAGLPCTSPS